MLLGTVIGHEPRPSSIARCKAGGWRWCNRWNNARQPEADPIIAVDKLNAGAGQQVVINADGKAARMIGDEKSPVRIFCNWNRGRMIVTARQLQDLHRQSGGNGQITLPYRGRLTPLASDWIRAKNW